MSEIHHAMNPRVTSTFITDDPEVQKPYWKFDLSWLDQTDWWDHGTKTPYTASLILQDIPKEVALDHPGVLLAITRLVSFVSDWEYSTCVCPRHNR